ncbi:LutC/YkgG family protein [Brachybacterium hainanense]|uniref:Lactate utilization protein C n=1 Tax=Brachybacterium hainanense TaxID=1541174 RepID=A0ABV6RAQ6_9MICO
MSTWHDSRPARTPGLSAKEEILARLRTALEAPRRDAVTEAAEVPRRYARADDRSEGADAAKVRDLLVKRLEDYTATVHRTTPSRRGRAIAEALREAGSVIVPAGVPEDWLQEIPAGVLRDDGSAGPRELDRIDAVLTGCHTAIAATGTILLRSDDLSGRRAISLLPDLHVVVLESEQVVVGVPRAIQRMGEDPRAPWTMISGPSATSDIELSRVEGVHGPRRLHIVLVEPEPEPSPDPLPEETPSA